MAEVVELASFQRRQNEALRVKSLHPDPITSGGMRDAYWDIANEWVKLRSHLRATRKIARDLELMAEVKGVPLPGIGGDVSDYLDNLEHDICAKSYEKGLLDRIQAWEEVN